MKMTNRHISQSKINHVALVIDASVSMSRHASTVVTVADGLIRHLAKTSQELDQETRVTVYTFGDDYRCLIFDKDVMRLPSIKDLYQIDGNTALIAATVKSQDDLAQTAQLYGDHAFLTYVITDGQENVSPWSTVFGGDGQRVRYHNTPARYSAEQIRQMLATRLRELPDNWTVACLVPDRVGVRDALHHGFLENNIQTWDTESKNGVLEVGKLITEATDTYMANRALGVRGSKTMFAKMSTTDLNGDVIRRAGLHVIERGRFTALTVTKSDDGAEIRPFVERALGTYVIGHSYYELMKPEKIQPQKEILVRHKRSGRVYAGRRARDILGLPGDREMRIKPDVNPWYRVFVQSTSVNRKLVAGTKLLVMHTS